MLTKILYFFAFLSFLSSSPSHAQDEPGTGRVTVFSEDGANFTLYLNGESKNTTPTTRVVVENVTEVPVSFRIVFENGSIPQLTKNGIRQGKDCLYVVHKNKKGQYALKAGGCSDGEPETEGFVQSGTQPTKPIVGTTISAPGQLSATYKEDIISINDGRQLTVKKVRVNGLTYPRIIFTALTGATISVKYDNGIESYSAESPMQYEVKDFKNNNAYFTLTVDEGGPAKTWYVKLKNNNGFDLKIE